MKSIPRPAKTVISLRLRLLGQTSDVARAIAPYAPVGYCAAVARVGEEPDFFFGGKAVLHETDVERDTIFRIASISKVFGAAAALRLVRRGKLALDCDVAEFLGFSAGRPITLRQLLTHTSSITDAVYDGVMFEPETMPLDKLLPQSFHPFAPGAKFMYSNLGAGVVGMLIESVTGMLFDDFIRQEFFAPLGIDASFHPQRIRRKHLMANCYNVPGNHLAYDAHKIAASQLDERPNPRVHYNIPAGKLMISAPDLIRVFRDLPKNDPDLFVYQKGVGSVPCDSGRGLGIAHAGPGVFTQTDAFWGHQGCAYGAVGEAWINAGNGTTAVILTNGAQLSPVGPLYRIGQNGVAALLNHAAQPKQTE